MKRLLLCFVAFSGCGQSDFIKKIQGKDDEKKNEEIQASEPTRSVLIIDDGFDTSLEVFSGKILAEVSILCEEAPDIESKDLSKMTVAEIKETLLEEFKVKVECRLEQGAKKPDTGPFQDILSKRDAWNSAIKSKGKEKVNRADYDAIKKVIEEGDFHGTSTASLVAYKNPGVRLVLVHLAINSPKEFEEKVECQTQEGIDNYIAAFDEDVFVAYESAPVEDYLGELIEIAEEDSVTIANFSFGSPSRQATEELYKEKGCGDVNLKEFYKLGAEKSKRRSKWLEVNAGDDQEILAFQSAGNDGDFVNSVEDTKECADEYTLTVGSITSDRRISSFSQRGDCVSFFALGDLVVTAAPENFFVVGSGTSFASPLAARHATLNFDKDLPLMDLKKMFEDSKDSRNMLPNEAWPEELAFDSETSVDSFSLRPKKQS